MFNKKMLALGQTRSAIRELFEYGKTLSQKIGKDKVFDFSLGNPFVPAPQSVATSIEKHYTEPTIHNYSSAQGDIQVRQRIADYNNATWNVGLSPDDIYVTTGAAAALCIVLKALCQGDGQDEIIAISPYFPEYKVFAEAGGAKLVEVRAKADFSLDVNAIEKAITDNTRAIIVNSPNNPTGVIYSKEQLQELCDVLYNKSLERGEPIYLISDEPYRELTYGYEVINVMNIYANSIICYSCSKSLSLAGERIGYIALAPTATQKTDLFHAICGAGRALGYVCAPTLFQHVLADCLGDCADVSEYAKRRDVLYFALKNMGYDCIEPKGAFYLFVKSPTEDNSFFEECKKRGVLIVPSDSFGVTGYFRISYCVAMEVIEGALPIFEELAISFGIKP